MRFDNCTARRWVNRQQRLLSSGRLFGCGKVIDMYVMIAGEAGTHCNPPRCLPLLIIGQLGIGSSLAQRYLSQTSTMNLMSASPPIQIGAGYQYACALFADGSVKW